MKRRKPKGHTLYWVYFWDDRETRYNFDTTPRLDEAWKILREEIAHGGWHHAYIFYGNEDGAFFGLDAADQYWS